LPLTQNPKLLPGDYHELVKVLKKVIAKVRTNLFQWLTWLTFK
jgi:hypothetical protein